MASIAIHSAGKLPSFSPTSKPAQISCINPLPPKKISQHITIVASSQLMTPNHHRPTEPASDSCIKKPNPPGKIDSWVQESVTDIVKNLKHAPLLVQIHSEFDGEVKIQTEKAVADKWVGVKDKWRRGESRSPDGLIFVEELERDEEGVRRAWGIVVQGKGEECVPACYLLQTDQVCAGVGLGFCTHFCLMRVNNFRDSALEQFQDSWLLQ